MVARAKALISSSSELGWRGLRSPIHLLKLDIYSYFALNPRFIDRLDSWRKLIGASIKPSKALTVFLYLFFFFGDEFFHPIGGPFMIYQHTKGVEYSFATFGLNTFSINANLFLVLSAMTGGT